MHVFVSGNCRSRIFTERRLERWFVLSVFVNERGESANCVGKKSQYASIWLRDFDPFNAYNISEAITVHKMRLLSLDVDATLKECNITKDGHELQLTWSDGHVTGFPATYLRFRDLSCEKMTTLRRQVVKVQRIAFSNASHLQHHEPPIRLWDSATFYSNVRHYYDFNELANRGTDLHDFLMGALRDGIALFRNGPTESGGIEKVISMIGIVEETHYGCVVRRIERE